MVIAAVCLSGVDVRKNSTWELTSPNLKSFEQ